MEPKSDCPSRFANGTFRQIEPSDELYLESLIRSDYESCHPGETFDDVKRRARFSPDDKGLLREWMELATQRATMAQAPDKGQSPITVE